MKFPRFSLSRMPMAALCCAGALAAAACASTAPQAALSDTRWTVTTMGGQALESRAPTIEFSQDRIAGTGGCNRYFGEYEASAETISIRQIGSTEMACEGPIMEREAQFFAALNAARSYSRLGDTLLINDGAGGTMTLRAAN